MNEKQRSQVVQQPLNNMQASAVCKIEGQWCYHSLLFITVRYKFLLKKKASDKIPCCGYVRLLPEERKYLKLIKKWQSSNRVKNY